MSNSQHISSPDVEIPDMDVTAWNNVLQRAYLHSRKIADQRTNYELITNNDHDDWMLLHRFEYDHFYSAWVGVAFRFRACDIHNKAFTALFQRTQGDVQDEGMYQEDDALFGFFVKGLSALEGFYYSLYALGALIVTPTQEPSVPPSDQFPLLTHLIDRAHPRHHPRFITPQKTYETYLQAFPGQPITELLGHMQEDEIYKEWSEIRNILAHRIASAGRTIQMSSPNFSSNEPPRSVALWGMNLTLDAKTTASRYTWLRKTINTALEETAAFAEQWTNKS